MTGRILALDVGTSSVKAVIFSHRGAIEARAEVKHQTSNSLPGRQEQSASEWWQNTILAVRHLDHLSDITAIVLSGTMQNVIAVDHDGEPLYPAILYGDSRGSAQFEALSPALDSLNSASIIGNAPNQFMAAFKMRWLLENERGVFDRADVIHSGAKDYIIHRLTGSHVTDPTAATTIGLMNLTSRSWHPELLRVFGVAEERLPAIKPSGAIIGHLTTPSAEQLGLRSGIPVINGLGDAGASTIGAGLTRVGEAYIYLGTTAWVARISASSEVVVPTSTFVLAHPDPDKIIEIAPLLSAGDCVEWLLDVAGTDVSKLAPGAKAVDASPPDLMFLPYLKGERSPFVDTAVRGGFLMMDRGHGVAHLFYAIMEGVAFSLRENLDFLGAQAGTIRLIGGGGASDVWPQLIADITERDIELAIDPATAPAFGAFCEAAHTLGWTHDASLFERRISPRKERQARNNKRRQLFLAATDFARALPQRYTAIPFQP
jgi:xylulokinase